MSFIIYKISTSPFLDPSHTLYEYIGAIKGEPDILDVNITVSKGDIFVSDEVYFDFSLIYTQDESSQNDQLLVKAPADKNSKEYLRWFCQNLTIDRASGKYRGLDVPIGNNEAKALCVGDKIVISVEIVPLNKTQNEWRYFKGSDKSLYAENARVLNDDKFSIVSDLSRYGAYLEHTKLGAPIKAYANIKRIAMVELTKGRYNIKVRLLDYEKTDGLKPYLQIKESWKKLLTTI